MKSNSTKLEVFQSSVYLYPTLIFLIWLVTYIICTILWRQKLGWDEVSYLTCARGIAENLDFSSRSTTVMGLIKYAFPQHTHHYPLISIYFAIFFKLFGVSLQVAYFASWLAALFTCIFIYCTLLLLIENNRFPSFVLAISFLFLPRITNYCNSGMMEIPGCGLISFLTFLVFKYLSKGKLNILLIAVSAILLFFYKSLFLGMFVGFFVLIISAYSKKIIGFKLESKIPLYLSVLIYFCIIVALYFIFTKFVFSPLAPMMTFNPKVSIPEGPYADFAGGFFNDLFGNLKYNYNVFFRNVIQHYFPYVTVLYPGTDAFFTFIPAWFELLTYFLFVFYTAAFLLISWKKITPLQRCFIIFSLTAVFTFNFAYISIVGAFIGLICRYNLIYLPLVIISSGIIIWINLSHFEKFYIENKKTIYFLILSFLLLVFVPFYYSAALVTRWDDDLYYNIAHKNSEIVKKYIGNSKPMFVYFTIGTHTTWDSFPTRVILMEATNEQIKKLNLKLPRPIEFLFLNPNNNLFNVNKDLIMKGLPIIDGMYSFFCVDSENRIIVYKYNPTKL